MSRILALLVVLLSRPIASSPDVLVSHSICGLVNEVNATLFRQFAVEKHEQNHFLDPDYELFVADREGDKDVLNLDYCGFTVGDDSLQIDVLCDEQDSCVCTTYFEGSKCSSCTMELQAEKYRFPYPVSTVRADCSGISDMWPNCLVLPDGDDEDMYPDIHACLDLSDVSNKATPVGSSREVGSGAAYNSIGGLLVLTVPALLMMML